MSNAVEWRWVDTDGSQQGATLAELREHLSANVLPPFVLVWRPGWGEWLQARYVPELASAVGEAADPQVPGPLDVSISEPPKPSLKDYVAAGQPLSKRFIEKPLPSLPSVKPVRSRPEPVRNVLPTLMEEPLEGHTSSTLRPTAALPPPPRERLPSRAPSFDDVDRSVPPLSDPDLHTPEDASPPGASDDSRVSTVPPRRSRGAPPPSNLALGATVLIAVLVVGAAVFFLNRRAGGGAAQPRSGAARAAPSQPTSEIAHAASGAPMLEDPGCVVVTPPKPVAPHAYIGVPPIVDDLPGQDGVAVGYAAESTRAVGLLLNPTTLSFDQPFAQDHPARIIGVVPLPGAEDTAFAVDATDSEFTDERTVSAARPFAVGVGNDGFSRRVGSSVTVIWPRPLKAPGITTPRIARAEGVGYLVVFRSGGKGGTMLTGWITPSGEKLTELSPVPAEESMLGTPNVAVGAAAAVVTFSAKESGPDTWVTRLAKVPVRGAATESRIFDVPAGGPGQDAISAGATALPRERYLLQWTEGARDNRVVRAATLDANLNVVSHPMTLSPAGEESGQGVIWSSGQRVVVLFFVKKQRNHELWGVSLKCP